ncbi:MAG: NAD(P)-dependent oxidoreductase [Pseudomonadota bacterium]
MRRIGVIGLGAMGIGMARTLAGAGFDVIGFDVDAHKRQAFAATAESLDDLYGGELDALVLSLPNDAVVRELMSALVKALPRGTLVIDTSTIGPETARQMQRVAAKHGVGYLDCPVSGGPAGAASGSLLIMVGAVERDVEAAMPVLAPLARKVARCGGPGAGATVKLANNVLCAGHLLLAGEAMRIAKAGGVSAEALLSALNEGSGRSAVSEVNLPRWVVSGSFDSGFTMGLMKKDVGLAAALPGAGRLSQEIATRWQVASAAIGDNEDFNRIVEGPAP